MYKGAQHYFRLRCVWGVPVLEVQRVINNNRRKQNKSQVIFRSAGSVRSPDLVLGLNLELRRSRCILAIEGPSENLFIQVLECGGIPLDCRNELMAQRIANLCTHSICPWAPRLYAQLSLWKSDARQPQHARQEVAEVSQNYIATLHSRKGEANADWPLRHSECRLEFLWMFRRRPQPFLVPPRLSPTTSDECVEWPGATSAPAMPFPILQTRNNRATRRQR